MANPAATATAGDKRTPGHDIVSWAIDLLTLMQVPVSPTNIGVLITWANHESGGYNPSVAGGRYNPLNTTETAKGGVAGSGGSQGNIRDYVSYEAGLANQAWNLTRPSFGYPAIIAGLRAQNPAATFAAINASAFGTHFPAGYTGSGPVAPGSHAPTPGLSTGTTAGGSSPGAQTAETQSLVGDAFSTILGNVPGLSTAIDAAALPAKFAGLLIGVFSNWRFVLELAAGTLLMLVGLNLIVKDISGRSVVQRAGDTGRAAGGAAALGAAA